MHYYTQTLFFVRPFRRFRPLSVFNLLKNENKTGYFDARERLFKISNIIVWIKAIFVVID